MLTKKQRSLSVTALFLLFFLNLVSPEKLRKALIFGLRLLFRVAYKLHRGHCLEYPTHHKTHQESNDERLGMCGVGEEINGDNGEMDNQHAHGHAEELLDEDSR